VSVKFVDCGRGILAVYFQGEGHESVSVMGHWGPWWHACKSKQSAMQQALHINTTTEQCSIFRIVHE